VDASPHATKREIARPSTTDEELQSFSYMVSHDMAASVRHLTEFSRMLLGELGEGLTRRQQTRAEQIRVAGDNCVMMLDQLLIFSRVQQRTLAKVRQDANSTLRLPMLLLAAQAQAAGAEISLEQLGEVYADPELLAIAFVRLMDNAIKFGRPDLPPRIIIRAAHDKAFWRMQISDNGLGVEPAYRDVAFRMFRRLHGPNAYPGVGAGLAICRRIARLHGGEANFIDSAEGACVELALPHAVRYAKSARHH
jgi:light-regulated signal transduction histidine kinase (bacteriophytochrome)